MSQPIVPFRKRFPPEVLLVVIESSDPSTLAALGAVSMDFLESSSRLLYRDVVVTSAAKLEMLFCERKEETTASPSRINHLLDISTLRTLHIAFNHSPWPTPSLRLARRRIPTPLLTIPLDTLILTTPSSYTLRNILELYHLVLLPLLDPLRLEYNDYQGDGTDFVFRLYATPLHHFTRLEEVVFRGVIPFHYQNNPDARLIAALPLPTLDRRRTLRIIVASLLSRNFRTPTSVVRRIPTNWPYGTFSTDPMQDGSIIFVVRTKEEKEEVEAALVKEMEEEWRSRFAVEIEGETWGLPSSHQQLSALPSSPKIGSPLVG
ncbi:hypothetical protein BDY24DRAFT_417611 [Mrakia frigida]|uniref:uncharacterized protein n=1 Tax=Mrakia frigida TaxID=29902 RepID=UPI003FCBF2B3